MEDMVRPLPHEALETRRRELAALACRYGLSNLRFFGSAARCTDHPGIDLDILAPPSPSESRGEPSALPIQQIRRAQLCPKLSLSCCQTAYATTE